MVNYIRIIGLGPQHFYVYTADVSLNRKPSRGVFVLPTYMSHL